MRILELKLYTSQLAAQTEFYNKTLGLVIYDEGENFVAFEFRNSLLIFEQREKATPYHIAINIPQNQENEALKWLKTKVEILKYGKNEMQDFTDWNAKAMYFYDKDKNIMELIARKNLQNTSNNSFNQNAFLEISEIGLPTTDIEKIFKQLNEKCGLEVYDGNFLRFCAIGGETGLIICVNKLIKKWFPTNDEAYSSDFWVKIQVKDKDYVLQFENGKLTIA